MNFQPHKYQTTCIDHVLSTPKAGLFIEMGLGKTSIILTVIDKLIYEDFQAHKVLIVAPLRVAYETWPRELEKWDHLHRLRASKVLGTAKQRVAGLKVDADIYIINRENVPWLVENWDWDFDMVVIDEISSFKSSKANRFRALRKVIPYCTRVVGLTGTPTPNGLTDLWSQIYLLDSGERLGKTVGGYKNRYFYPAASYGHVVTKWALRDGAEEAIHNKIADTCISMQSKDWLELPDRIDIEKYVELDERERSKYNELESDAYLEYKEEKIVALSAVALTQKLLQYSNGAVYYGDKGESLTFHNRKLDALEDIIESANGKSVLVYYSFKSDARRIKERFPYAEGIDIDRWNKGEIALMIAHPASAGHGLNLQEGGSILVWFGLPWSLELYEQANARLHRQGQTETVRIYHLMTAGTVDKVVYNALKGKAKVQDALIQRLKRRGTDGESRD